MVDLVLGGGIYGSLTLHVVVLHGLVKLAHMRLRIFATRVVVDSVELLCNQVLRKDSYRLGIVVVSYQRCFSVPSFFGGARNGSGSWGGRSACRLVVVGMGLHQISFYICLRSRRPRVLPVYGNPVAVTWEEHCLAPPRFIACRNSLEGGERTGSGFFLHGVRLL